MLVNEAGAKLIVLKKGNHFWDKDDHSELKQALSQELSAFTH